MIKDGIPKRNKRNAEAPGAYQLATKAKTLILNPGETLSFEQYITGYGSIANAKIQSYISDDVFEKGLSEIRYGGKLAFHNGVEVLTGWGGLERQIDPEGFHASIPSDDEFDTYFVDDPSCGPDKNRVITEVVWGHAPYEFNLKIRSNAPVGIHHIDFYFTYFNGSSWITGKERVEFKINNNFERFNTLLSALAAAALIVTILHDGIGPFFELIHNIGKFVGCWKLIP